MEREKTDERFQQIRQMAFDDPAILAFFVTGSRAVGFETEHSDYDCALVVADEAFESYEHRFEDYEPEIETGIFTLESFRSHAAWGSELAWDRYDWAHAVARSGQERRNHPADRG